LLVGVVSKEMELGLQSLLAANGYGFYGWKKQWDC
jgi:hypothetical protein